MVNPRIIIVTGSNRGIGKAICNSILQRPNLGPLKLFAASRSGGDLALQTNDPSHDILYPRLDLSSSASIRDLADTVKQHGPVHVLINNAGVNLDQPSLYGPENARKTLDVNFRGTVQMCRTFMPQLSNTGRIVNLASVASRIHIYSPEIQARLRDAQTLDDLETIAQDFEHAVQTSTEHTSGFNSPGRSYNISKALLRAATTLLARECDLHARASDRILVNCCCPGWIDTEMGGIVSARGTRPPKSPEDGARIPVRLALEDLGGVSGEYWANESVRSRGSGEVQKWD